MKVSTKVERRIRNYSPQGGLDQTSLIFLKLSAVNHPHVKAHLERVALLADESAKVLKKDNKAAFFGGLLHDVGKIILPYQLFDGHDIDTKEYVEVKTHALAGFEILRDLHLFSACCAGIHHALYKKGYGLMVKDFPQDWSVDTIRKVLDISAIISICDFVDAFTHRKTKIKDQSDSKSPNLRGMLKDKYSNDQGTIDVVLRINKELNM